SLPSFAIDRFPVTTARYQACVAAGVCRPVEVQDPDLPADYPINPAYANAPVRGVNWYDAQTYCHWVGKRLPTEMEWEKAARGTDGRRYPWGNDWNSEYVTPLLSPIGMHPQGASPYGVEDLLSEGGEWTLSIFRYYPGNPGPQGREMERNWPAVRGYSPHQRPIWWVTFRFRQYPLFGGKVGFRCARGPMPPPTLEEALVEVELPPTPQPAAEVDLSNMVYVPAGPFLMGYSEPYINERGHNERANAMPLHVVDLDAFYIDRYEVTYREYLRFLNAMGGHEFACYGFHCVAVWREGDPDSLGSPIRQEEDQYRVGPELEDLPVGYVSWYGAAAYCAWLGKRLPTEAEWEKAARGTDGRLFPWGNEWDPRWPMYDTGDTRPVGINPLDISPYGVHDMLGNEVEWVSDWYAPDYYAHSPHQNPSGPAGGERRVYRSLGGGVDLQGKAVFALPRRSSVEPVLPSTGFRCAYSPGQEQRER
ncbi:MAG: formylglycine-generating enzyme family protein, partial [Anaerolineae bacterium]